MCYIPVLDLNSLKPQSTLLGSSMKSVISLKLGSMEMYSWDRHDVRTWQLNFLTCFPDTAVIHDTHEEKMENGQSPADGFLLKSAPAEFMNVSGEGLIPNQLDSLSDDFTGLRKDGFIHKPGNNILLGGAKTCNLSVDDQKITMASALETVPNSMQITPAMAQGINADIKHQLMKEVRKFGRSK